MNFEEGSMTVLPSIIVSEPTAVIIGEDAAVASETTVIQVGINRKLPILRTFINLYIFSHHAN
jgi:hypothetical protein